MAMHHRTKHKFILFLTFFFLCPALVFSIPLSAAAAPASGNSFQEEAEARKEMPVESTHGKTGRQALSSAPSPLF